MQKHGRACSHPHNTPALHIQLGYAYSHHCCVPAQILLNTSDLSASATMFTRLLCPNLVARWGGHACLHACHIQAMPCGGVSTHLHTHRVSTWLPGSTGKTISVITSVSWPCHRACKHACPHACHGNTITCRVGTPIHVPTVSQCTTALAAETCLFAHLPCPTRALGWFHHACLCLPCPSDTTLSTGILWCHPSNTTWQWGTPVHVPVMLQHHHLVVCAPPMSQRP